MGKLIDDSVKQKLLDSLAKEPPMVISTAYAYAKNYVLYGVDITKAWTTVVEQAAILEQVKIKAQVEAYDDFKKKYEARLQADMKAMLTELKLEIEELKSYESVDGQDLVMLADIGILFDQKIDALKESQAEVLYDKALAAMRNYAKSKEGENNGIHEN